MAETTPITPTRRFVEGSGVTINARQFNRGSFSVDQAKVVQIILDSRGDNLDIAKRYNYSLPEGEQLETSTLTQIANDLLRQ